MNVHTAKQFWRDSSTFLISRFMKNTYQINIYETCSSLRDLCKDFQNKPSKKSVQK
jgi:hypothetical protein